MRAKEREAWTAIPRWHRFGFGMLSLLLATASARAQTEAIRGVVRREDDSTAIAGVVVRLPELQRAATSDAHGAFRFAGVPAGRWVLEIRRIGFTQLDTVVRVPDQSAATFTFVLNVAPRSLDTVSVHARLPSSATISEFERRRTHETGHFITREQLRAMDDRNFVDVLRARMPGILFLRSPTGVWAYSPSQQAPQALYSGRGKPCYTQIVVDGVMVYSPTDRLGPGVDPPDISEYLTPALDAVEYYSSPSRTPPEFRTSGAQCGTLALWTRRR